MRTKRGTCKHVGDETVDLGVSDELLQKGIRKSRPAGSADEGVGEMVM